MQIRCICVSFFDVPTSGRSMPSSTHCTVFDVACSTNIGGGIGNMEMEVIYWI